jgi:hypothetical protein
MAATDGGDDLALECDETPGETIARMHEFVELLPGRNDGLRTSPHIGGSREMRAICAKADNSRNDFVITLLHHFAGNGDWWVALLRGRPHVPLLGIGIVTAFDSAVVTHSNEEDRFSALRN